jgi:hypothetical protein
MRGKATSRRVGAAALFALLAAGWAWRGERASYAGFAPSPLPRALSDRAVDCLAAGTVRPGLGELPQPELEAIVEIIGRSISAYELGDYDSFLALRAGDLESAARRRAGDVDGLRELGRELENAPSEPGDDWIAALGSFWKAYYERPAVVRFVPEHTRVELHEEGLGARSLASWTRSFEELRDRIPGFWIRHELSMPHRRDIEQVACDAGPLRWLDLELHFETHEGRGARLLARFVWDGVLREWFLQDAASIYAKDDRSQRHLIL